MTRFARARSCAAVFAMATFSCASFSRIASGAEPTSPGSTRPAAATPSTTAPSSASTSGPERRSLAAAPSWLPSETKLVVRIRYPELRTSSLFRQLRGARPLFDSETAHIERFASDGDLDIARDLDLAWVGTDGREAGESVAVLSGRFDSRAASILLERKGASRSSHSGTELFTLRTAQARKDRASTARPTVVAFPAPDLALVGTSGWVRLALDRGAPAGMDTKRPAQFEDVLARCDEGASVWSGAMGVAVSEMLRSEVDHETLADADLGSVRFVVASFRITDAIRVNAEAACASEEDAGALEIVLRGLLAVGALQSYVSDPDLSQALRGVSVESRGRGVRFLAHVPGALALRN